MNDVGPLALDQERHGVHAEARDALLQPEAHDAHDLLAHLGIGGVQIRLEPVEPVKIVFAGDLVLRPRRLLDAGKHHALVVAGGPLLRPDVPVPIRGVRVLSRRLEPRVFLGRVVDDEVDDDAHAELLGVVHEVHELAERAVLRVDVVVIGDVVAVVAVGRRVERLEPETCHAEPREVVQPARQSREIAHAIAIAVHVLLDVEAVNHRVLVPKVINHARSRSKTRAGLRSLRATAACRFTGATEKRRQGGLGWDDVGGRAWAGDSRLSLHRSNGETETGRVGLG